MTSKERWYNVLARKAVDKVPCDFTSTPEVVKQMCEALNCGDFWELTKRLEVDVRNFLNPRYCGPVYGDEVNMWGVKVRDVNYGTGVYTEAVGHPLADMKTLAEYKTYNWPTADWFDYCDLKQQLNEHRDNPSSAVHIEPFLNYAQMRGLEQAMMDLAIAPDLVEYAFDRMFELATCQFERILNEVGEDLDMTITAEDLASQTGPMFSVEMFIKFHKQRFAKYIALAKQANVAVFYHTDGAAREFIPDLIDMGIDVLNPIQWRCQGMERDQLKVDFGDKLIFHGGIDNQQTLPFSSPEDVHREVIECFELLGIGGGYICAPCHNIQPVTPVENILKMYATIKEISSDKRFTCPLTQPIS